MIHYADAYPILIKHELYTKIGKYEAGKWVSLKKPNYGGYLHVYDGLIVVDEIRIVSLDLFFDRKDLFVIFLKMGITAGD